MIHKKNVQLFNFMICNNHASKEAFTLKLICENRSGFPLGTSMFKRYPILLNLVKYLHSKAVVSTMMQIFGTLSTETLTWPHSRDADGKRPRK